MTFNLANLNNRITLMNLKNFNNLKIWALYIKVFALSALVYSVISSD